MENEEKNIEEGLLNSKEEVSESNEEDLNSIEISSQDESVSEMQNSQEEKTVEEKLKEQDEFSFLDNEDPIHEKDETANEIEEKPQDLITVRPVKFQEFEAKAPNRTIKKNLDILQDVSMHISVELGRTKSSIKEVINFEAGSIVELDKIAGEQVEVFVNDKLIAKGEVIVIEDKFGVRITSTNIQKQM